MRTISQLITITLMSLLAIACRGIESNDGSVTSVAPQLVSASPANGATDIPKGNVDITLTFDQNITFLSANVGRIEISGGTVKSARASQKNLLISANCPDAGAEVSIHIPKGLVKNTRGGEADAIRLSFTIYKPFAQDKSKIRKAPITSFEPAVKLYKLFYDQYGEKIFSSVMADVSWNNSCAEKVYKLTGEYPAMNCYDFIHIHHSPANWIDYTKIDPVKQWVDAGGLVQLMWHFNVPLSEGSNDWNAKQATAGFTFKASNALKEGAWENKVFYEQMDKVADTILKLQEAGIAATWRPFHEAAGNSMARTYAGKAWFWWGDEGAEVFKQLWIAMYDHFHKKGIKNLIWIWTTQNHGNDPSSYDQDTSWYPGDEYVDIVARDLYGRSAADNQEEFAQIQETYPTMMVALGECGYNNSKQDPALISKCWETGAFWSHFMVWYQGGYGSTGTMCSDAWWQDAMQAECVITREQLENLY